MRANGFIRRTIRGLPCYCCLALEDLQFVHHGFSARHGGVSRPPEALLNLSHIPWDNPESVAENRRRLLAALAPDAVHLVTLRQVHGDRMHIIGDSPQQWNRGLEGDALGTRQPGTALAVQVADCLPVLIVDPEMRVVAAIHAGWRSVRARILSKAVRTLQSAFLSNPDRMLAAIGPGIRECCMEVGPEVRSLFDEEYGDGIVCRPHPARSGKFLLNLRAALDIQFAEAGVDPGRVFDLRACTRCNPQEFFSHRAEGANSGRMMGLISLAATAGGPARPDFTP